MARCTAILIFVACLHVSAKTFSQRITLKEKNTPLEKVLKTIEQKSGYHFIYRNDWLKQTHPVSIDITNASVENAVAACLKGQPLSYSVLDKLIVLSLKDAPKNIAVTQPIGQDISGLVTDTTGTPMANVSVSVLGSNHGTVTDKNGNFLLKEVDVNMATIVFDYVGYKEQKIKLNGKHSLSVIMYASHSELDALQVIAYGTTTKRLNTGDVSIITAKEIERQPVSNPLATLEGRISGLVVTQSSGIAGASFSVQLRGQNSIFQGNDPLFIIDGVPYAPSNNNLGQAGGPFTFDLAPGHSGGMSPFNGIAPSDIESITILKDADATSIYGSRGANGVILITTKKGKAGKTRVNVNMQTGGSRVTRIVNMLNTKEYVNMRKEAFANDNVTMTNGNAYDLLLWDTTRYTNWGKYLIGNTANTKDIQTSVSGGNENTQFLIGGNFHHESTVFPGKLFYNRGGIHFNINHNSINKRFNINLTGSYSTDQNNNSGGDLTGYLNTLPNAPLLYDSLGNLNWSEDGYTFNNPVAFLKQTYEAKTDNLIANMQISYRISNGLKILVNSGFNSINVNELSTDPISAQYPGGHSVPTGHSTFGNQLFKSIIIEPQISYEIRKNKNKIQFLLGSTWQSNNEDETLIRASGYTNDALLKSASAASSVSSSSSYNQYKYAAIFGRINYGYNNTYLIDLTARRDGSSRFGPGRQYANFGAAGAAWIFSNLKYFKEHSSFLSYGKLRGSYGASGNDAIGDYQYLDTYSSTQYPYDGTPGLYPTRLFNPNYGWEINKKLEVAIELGLFDNRILLNTSFYENKSSNQLINYTLPAQTGFSSILENLPAKVKNTGIEIDLNTTNIKTKTFEWKTSLNLSFPKNELVSFPNLATSSYRNLYVIGKSLNEGRGYITAGVNPQTGLYNFIDSAGAISSTPTNRIIGLVNLDPKYYGGLSNDFIFKNWSLSFFFDFRKQMGYSWYYGTYSVPGQIINQPTIVLDAWEKPGDKAVIPKYTQSYSSPAFSINSQIYSNGADINYANASFIRLRNIALGYEFPHRILNKIGLDNLKIYVEGQNLFLITNYYGTDPETQMISRLPPLKSLVAGIQLSF